MLPEDRLEEALKQIKIVRQEHPLNPDASIDLATALVDIETAKAEYERARENVEDCEVVE